MISTQRLIMIVVLINLMTGIVGNIYIKPTTYDNNIIAGEEDYSQQYSENLLQEDKYSGIRNRGYDSEQSIGNSITLGSNIWDIIIDGVNPLSVHPNMFESDIEKMFAIILSMFRLLLGIILIVEIYMIFKNRKQS